MAHTYYLRHNPQLKWRRWHHAHKLVLLLLILLLLGGVAIAMYVRTDLLTDTSAVDSKVNTAAIAGVTTQSFSSDYFSFRSNESWKFQHEPSDIPERYVYITDDTLSRLSIYYIDPPANAELQAFTDTKGNAKTVGFEMTGADSQNELKKIMSSFRLK